MTNSPRRRVPDRAEVEDVLRAIDDAIVQRDYDLAQRLLGAAQHEWEIGDREQQAQLARRTRDLLDHLAARIRDGLAASEFDYVALEGLLNQVERLNNTHPSLSRWREQLSRQLRIEQQKAQIDDIEQEIKRRWQEAEVMEASGVSGERLINFLEAAKFYAEEQAANIRSPRLQGLLQQATDRYNRCKFRLSNQQNSGVKISRLQLTIDR